MSEYDSARECAELRKEFLGQKDAFDGDVFDDEQPEVMKESIPALESGWGQYGVYEVVGNGSITNDNCDKFRSYYGCLRSHDVIASDGKNYKGKVYVKRVNCSCDKPSCPKCFKYGWAPREAGKIETRLKEGSKRFGLVEHIVATVPPKFYGLTFESLRAKIVAVLFARGVIGGVLIFHGFRYNLRKYFYWSPHFHVLGFILGGYKCRGCSKCVRGCGGFVDRSYRCFEKDGCVVRVLGKRKTVGGTAWYQLNHATIKVGSPRFHVATWFGACSYRRLKVTPEKRRSLCPICGFDLVKLRYNGNRFVKDENLIGDRRSFFADAVDECGFPIWVADENARRSG